MHTQETPPDGTSRPNKATFGVFVLLAVVLAAVICVVVGVHLLHPGRLLCETYVDGPVFGIDAGSAVRYRGIPVGKVRAVELAWSHYGSETPDTREGELAGRWARVVFSVNPRTTLGTDAMGEWFRDEVSRGLRVSLRSQGVSDTGYLDLDYPAVVNDLPSPPWVPEHLYVPSVPSLMQTLTGTMQNIAKEAAKVGTLADSLDSFLSTVTLACEEGRLPVADIADNLRRATASLDELMERLREDPSILLRPNPASQGSDPPDR